MIILLKMRYIRSIRYEPVRYFSFTLFHHENEDEAQSAIGRLH